MGRKSRPFPEQQRFNPSRRPTWRWDRANDLINTGRRMSRKRDDEATGIAVQFIRETNRCLTEARLKRVQQRFLHLARAQDTWRAGRQRLEIETRIIARQSDTEIALETGLPGPTIQAYSDLFFHVRDRIDALGYMQFQVIGIHPRRTPTETQLMQMAAYHHGPLVIDPWMAYMRDEGKKPDLSRRAGRLAESIDLFVAVQRLSDDEDSRDNFIKRMSALQSNFNKPAASVSASQAFAKSTAAIITGLELPIAELKPLSYAPDPNPRPNHSKDHLRKAA